MQFLMSLSFVGFRVSSSLSGLLQLLEIPEICNFTDAPGKFNCQLEYDNMPITEPNLATSLSPRNCHLTIFLCSFIHNVVHN